MLYCAVQGVLVLEFIVFLVPIVTWAMLKHTLRRASLIKSLKRQLNAFRYNVELFNLALTNQQHYVVGSELLPVILGNPDAKTTIILVSDPFCKPCKTHHSLDEWLYQRDDLQVKLLFYTVNEERDPATLVARHLITLGLLKGKYTVMKALKDWYDDHSKDYEAWIKRNPVFTTDVINEVVKTACENQKKWCDTAGINYTPAVLVNGYKLPEPYRLEDLKYFIN